ncbi:uncharacterized protein YfbL-like isoform X2 [Glandiceps talaboti]
MLTDHFSLNRHHEVNIINKDNVRNYIREAFESSKLNVQIQEFPKLNFNVYDGVNIIGVLPGELQGTPEDNVVLLGAHYDTVAETPGVDDNGSGMAVLLAAASMFHKENDECKQRNTVVFVAFDLEEYQEAADSISVGSYHFVNDWLEPFLQVSHSARSGFQGALVMETVLNYNKADNSQTFPEGLFQFFPTVGQNLMTRNYRGDFLTIIGRRDDSFISTKLASNLAKVNVTDMYTEVFMLPFEGVPTQEHINLFGDFFRSDHIRFWYNGQPALFITDTANFRKPMDGCYHESCDNADLITEDNLLFLARTTKAAVGTIRELSMNCPTGGGDSVHIITPLYILITMSVSMLSHQ